MNDKIDIFWPVPGFNITTITGETYTLGNVINEGGCAFVLDGIDSFGNPVALKLFKPALRSFEDVKTQWENECKLFEKLRHPNIVAIYDHFIYGNLFYIVLERANDSVYNLVNKFGPIPELTVIEMTRQLLFAIHFIHKNNIVHRDITIYNILYFQEVPSSKLIFKISDFGISKDFSEICPWQPHVCSTNIAHPTFIPPELLLPQYGYTSEQSDLYHLGLVLLYALTGNLPINELMSKEEITQAILKGRPRIAAEKLNSPLGYFISILLRRRQEYRYSSALEAWTALKASPV
ncbi:tyrosine-protein kinase active site [Lucifera butyrica]|uniref:Tyrosine-protein kinase active site n=1 Tax=Lucifera butyrica TaxID=1351585 RepID=A0A498R2L4_9FIRM|nr:serine/threonine-protein kinase [Lucifera butyrica]VBB05704.1 tyrosine-protein kinase active site [Lucifera butyrica]